MNWYQYAIVREFSRIAHLRPDKRSEKDKKLWAVLKPDIKRYEKEDADVKSIAAPAPPVAPIATDPARNAKTIPRREAPQRQAPRIAAPAAAVPRATAAPVTTATAYPAISAPGDPPDGNAARRQVLAALRNHVHMTAGELVKALPSLDPSSIYVALATLRKEGVIRTEKRPEWAVPKNMLVELAMGQGTGR